MRARAAAGLAFLGIAISPDANEQGDGDREVTEPGSAVRTLVLRAREDLEIVRQVHELLYGTGFPPGRPVVRNGSSVQSGQRQARGSWRQPNASVDDRRAAGGDDHRSDV